MSGNFESDVDALIASWSEEKKEMFRTFPFDVCQDFRIEWICSFLFMSEVGQMMRDGVQSQDILKQWSVLNHAIRKVVEVER